MLLNQTLTPNVLGVRLAPVFARLNAAKEAATQPSLPAPSAPDRLSQLKQLGELHSSGVLTDAEFEAEKARILASA